MHNVIRHICHDRCDEMATLIVYGKRRDSASGRTESALRAVLVPQRCWKLICAETYTAVRKKLPFVFEKIRPVVTFVHKKVKLFLDRVEEGVPARSCFFVTGGNF